MPPCPPAPVVATPPSAITAELLAWYDRSRRRLPWRALPGEASDPYAVWLSEVMLQQTTVQAVKPYFARFLGRWPTVTALAAAPVEEVMREWAGLGYYSRARNLHAAALTVARQHGGRFPGSEAGLRALPGIGAYTAAAVAAIAFGRPATVVDGNVERVMARLHAIDRPLAAARPLIRQKMGEATPEHRPGDFAQAVMDLGATICTPKNPACTICPVLSSCEARAQGLQDRLPLRPVKPATPMRHGITYYVTDEDGMVFVRRRPPTGLLGGMIELPGTGWTVVEAEPAAWSASAPALTSAGRVTHTFTHFTLFLDVVVARTQSAVPHALLAGCWPLSAEDLDAEALPTLMRNAVAAARAQGTIMSRRDRAPGSHRRRRS